MTLDPHCEPLLDELFNCLINDPSGEVYFCEIDDNGKSVYRPELLAIIDKHLCPCGHNYRKRTIE